MEEKKLTGYASIDKPWLKYYGIGIYPEDNAFVEKDTTYNSYIYQPK